MIDRKAYRSFRRNLAKILDDCSLSEEDIVSRPRLTYYDDTGAWEETEHIHYYFDMDKVKSHKDAILDLCRDLPKLDGTIAGFACAISPFDLLRDPASHAIFMYEARRIDEFALLVRHSAIGLIVPIEVKGVKTFLITIFEEYADRVLADGDVILP